MRAAGERAFSGIDTVDFGEYGRTAKYELRNMVYYLSLIHILLVKGVTALL